MFTVKTIINGVTHICEQPSVTIARAGCEQFKDILARTNDHSNPDFAIWLPAAYRDIDCKDVLQEEELIVSERLPALALANRLYQDGSRANELIQEANVPHPAFMPITMKVLRQ
ncbi:hypothetical protein [Raoultella terrigena]|uniref:hypothetical protein n=1 Tax=Raoultella terrigena TaxID=577 RepID=UPI003BF532D0